MSCGNNRDGIFVDLMFAARSPDHEKFRALFSEPGWECSYEKIVLLFESAIVSDRVENFRFLSTQFLLDSQDVRTYILLAADQLAVQIFEHLLSQISLDTEIVEKMIYAAVDGYVKSHKLYAGYIMLEGLSHPYDEPKAMAIKFTQDQENKPKLDRIIASLEATGVYTSEKISDRVTRFTAQTLAVVNSRNADKKEECIRKHILERGARVHPK